MTARKLVHSENDIKAGILKVEDAYDLKLYLLPSGDYELVVFMKLQFFFEGSKGLAWLESDEVSFVKLWETAIKQSWDNKTFKLLSSGKKVRLKFEFEIQRGGFMFDNWEISVTKIKQGAFKTSYVSLYRGKVTLDSEDLTPVNKGAKSMQRGAVHEFGHMLGLDDEYHAGSKHSADKISVMHSSEFIRPRHNSTMTKWLNDAMMFKGIQ